MLNRFQVSIIIFGLFLNTNCFYITHWNNGIVETVRRFEIVQKKFNYTVHGDRTECERYCGEHDECLAANSDGQNCFVYSTYDFLMKRHYVGEYPIWFAIFKNPDPKIGEIIYGMRLTNPYRFLRSFSLNACFSKCLTDPKCHAVDYNYGALHQCYFYYRHNLGYQSDSNYVSVFKLPDGEVNIKQNCSLVSSYTFYSFKSNALCYNQCYKDANCRGVTYLTNTDTNNCLLGNNTSNFLNNTNATSFIKLIDYVETTPKPKPTTTTIRFDPPNNAKRILLTKLLITVLLILSLFNFAK